MYEDHDDWLEEPSRLSNRVQRRDRGRTKTKKKKDREPDVPRASRDAPTEGGVVVEVGPGSATVVTAAGDELACVVDPELRKRQRAALAVGDEVVVAREVGIDVIRRVAPRRTALTRMDPHNMHQERVIVANVDVVVVVGAATDPPLRPRLVDRYLVAIQRGGAEPLVVVNKVDLADEARLEALEALVQPWRDAGIEVLSVSASSGENLGVLAQRLAGLRCAFVGHSGVGKSSLVTALGSAAEAGDLAEHGRGRHTTSTSTLHRLPSGTEIIDTPGVRQFALWRLTRRELRWAFPELREPGEACAFADCTHDHEEDCGVRDAVEAGRVSAARYDSYLRLLATCSE